MIWIEQGAIFAMVLVTAIKSFIVQAAYSLNFLQNVIMKNPKIEIAKLMHTFNGLPPSVLSGRVSYSSSGDRRVP